MNKSLKVAIASTSIEKIQGFKEAFSRFYNIKESQIEIYYKKIESGVSNQPFDSETYKGALNRVNSIKEDIDGYDFYVSCEAGIESFENLYFNVQVVCIYESKTQDYLWGKSAGWQIPSTAIEEIKEKNLDEYLKGKEITRIELLLGKRNSRREAVLQAASIALATKKLI